MITLLGLLFPGHSPAVLFPDQHREVLVSCLLSILSISYPTGEKQKLLQLIGGRFLPSNKTEPSYAPPNAYRFPLSANDRELSSIHGTQGPNDTLGLKKAQLHLQNKPLHPIGNL
jgi:hypothetical protein